jgi:branched-chain amino acid transport system permease protein
LFLLPFTWSEYNMSQASAVVVLVIIAVGYNLVIGYSGQFVVFSAAMVGVGAYGMAWLLEHGVAWPVAMVAVMVLTGVLGYVVGALAVRLRGVYLALASLGFAEAVGIVLNNWTSVTGGQNGLAVPTISLGGSAPPSSSTLYTLVIVMTAASLLVSWRLTSSQWARNLTAVSYSEVAARAAGINVAGARRTAVGVGCVYWGLAGALSALLAGYLSPDDYGLTPTIQYLAMTVVGGLGTFAGPILGAVTLGSLPDILKFSAGLETLLFAVSLYVVVLLFPGGLNEGFVRAGQFGARTVRRGLGRIRKRGQSD